MNHAAHLDLTRFKSQFLDHQRTNWPNRRQQIVSISVNLLCHCCVTCNSCYSDQKDTEMNTMKYICFHWDIVYVHFLGVCRKDHSWWKHCPRHGSIWVADIFPNCSHVQWPYLKYKEIRWPTMTLIFNHQNSWICSKTNRSSFANFSLHRTTWGPPLSFHE